MKERAAPGDIISEIRPTPPPMLSLWIIKIENLIFLLYKSYLFTLVSLFNLPWGLWRRTELFISCKPDFLFIASRQVCLLLSVICVYITSAFTAAPPGPLTACLLGLLQMFDPPAGLMWWDDRGGEMDVRGREDKQMCRQGVGGGTEVWQPGSL